MRRGISDDTAPQLLFHSIHLSFVTSDTVSTINEEYLMQAFSSFGGLEDCVVKQHVLSKHRKKQGGYAFLYFQSQAAAKHVIEQVNLVGGKFGNVLYDAKFSCTSPGGQETFSLVGDACRTAEKDAHRDDFQKHSNKYPLVQPLSLPFQPSKEYSKSYDQGVKNIISFQSFPSATGSMDTVMDYHHPAISIMDNSSASTPTTSFYSTPSYLQHFQHGHVVPSTPVFSQPSPSPIPNGVTTSTHSFYVSSSGPRHVSPRMWGQMQYGQAGVPTLCNDVSVPAGGGADHMCNHHSPMSTSTADNTSAAATTHLHGQSLYLPPPSFAAHPSVMHVAIVSSNTDANHDETANAHDIKSNPVSNAAPVYNHESNVVPWLPNGMPAMTPIYYPPACLPAQPPIISTHASFRPYQQRSMVYYSVPSQQHPQSTTSHLTPPPTSSHAGAMVATPAYYAYSTWQPSHLSDSLAR